MNQRNAVVLGPIVAVWICLPLALAAQDSLRTPGQIVEEAAASEWREPDPENLVYLQLASGLVIFELAPAFAPGHAEQVRALAREGFYEGLTFYRVVEGFVAQGGDVEGNRKVEKGKTTLNAEFERPVADDLPFTPLGAPDGYAAETGFAAGFPAARDTEVGRVWLVHCPGAVAMARGNDPDSGGTEIYVVIGHTPRYLDRNLSVFGRVLRGQEVLQALPRGDGPGGMISDPERRTPIVSVRVGSDVPEAERVPLEVLKTGSDSFHALIASRRNRPEEFFVYRPDHIDVCGVQVPVREPPDE